MPHKNIFILENGESLELYKEGTHRGSKVDSGIVLIDGLGIGDVGNIVLRDRRILSEEGLIIVVVALEKATGKMKSGPDIVSRGFVYVRESEDMIQSAVQVAKKAMEKCDQKNIREWNQIKNALRDDLKEYFWQQTKRRPMILPIIMDV
jgi:ribonuclease J